MRAQICFFVGIVFSFVAWGAVTGSLILPELRRRAATKPCGRCSCFILSASSAWRSWSPASCPPICRGLSPKAPPMAISSPRRSLC